MVGVTSLVAYPFALSPGDLHSADRHLNVTPLLAHSLDLVLILQHGGREGERERERQLHKSQTS